MVPCLPSSHMLILRSTRKRSQGEKGQNKQPLFQLATQLTEKMTFQHLHNAQLI